MKRPLQQEENTAPATKKLKKESSFVEYFSAREKGKKTYLEDRIISIPDLSSRDESDVLKGGKYSLFCVFDGHGGAWVANKLVSLLPTILIQHLVENPPHKIEDKATRYATIKRALVSSFLKCDEEILKIQEEKGLHDGSTATVCFLDDKMLWTANIGDTKAVLAVKKKDTVKGVSLTKDHTADKSEEQKRISQGKSGYVENNRVLGILEVTRSFGDPSFKRNGVICVPYISKVPISNKIEFVCIATDGLWSVWKNSEVTAFIEQSMNHPAKPTLRELTRQVLEETILHRNCQDNCSMMILKFKKGE